MLNGKITIRLQNKIANAIVLAVLAVGSVIAQPASYQIDGTTGAPLGGIGTGAVKFCDWSGAFAASFKTPCVLGIFQILANTQFQFFSQIGQQAPVTSQQLKAVQTGGRADDDAIYPVQYANFGTINNIAVKLTAFCPWDLTNVQLMNYPYTFYQIQVTNTGTAAATVAVALQASLTGGTVLVPGKGIKNDDGTLKRAVYAKSDDSTAVISAGNDSTAFFTTGACGSVSGIKNRVAVTVTLNPNETKRIKFVYAWYNNINGDEAGGTLGMFYYMNTFSTTFAGAVADTGMVHFESFRDNAVSLVTRMRGSNFPDWIKNQALLSLANLSNSSMYRMDGRYAHTEGEWNTNGTMDQMWHARQIYSELVPSLNWQELKYWASTQHISGQIHHDIDSCSDASDPSHAFSRNTAFMTEWNNTEHDDYRDITLWPDLNCAFIISVYETFIATADTAKLSYFMPYVKKAFKRLQDQLASFNDQADGFPYLFDQTQNSYDASDVPDGSFYNNSIAIVTYKILSNLAVITADPNKSLYDKLYDSVRTEFPKKYLVSGKFPTVRSEATMTGQWLSRYLKLGDLFDTSKINFAVNYLISKYNPLTNGMGSYTYDQRSGTYNYSEWAPYMISHFGGLLLQTGKLAEWKAMQSDLYQRNTSNRNTVYNQPLGMLKVLAPNYLADQSTDRYGGFNCFEQYISTPVIWRNYYTMVGFTRNKYSKELWLEPIVIPDLNHQMQNAVVFTPEGWATISCTESGTNFMTQDITFTPDSVMPVSSIYLKDKGSQNIYVWVNGVLQPTQNISRIGSGYSKEVKVSWNTPIPTTGILIRISDNSIPGSVLNIPKLSGMQIPKIIGMKNSMIISTCSAIPHEISVVTVSGKIIRHFSGIGAKQYKFDLNSGVYIIRITSGSKVYTERAICSQ